MVTAKHIFECPPLAAQINERNLQFWYGIDRFFMPSVAGTTLQTSGSQILNPEILAVEF